MQPALWFYNAGVVAGVVVYCPPDSPVGHLAASYGDGPVFLRFRLLPRTHSSIDQQHLTMNVPC